MGKEGNKVRKGSDGQPEGKEGNKTPNGAGGKAKVKANVSLVLMDKEGKIKTRMDIDNIIVTPGFNAMIKQVMGDAGGGSQPAKFNYVGIGTSAAAPASGDAALGSEIGTRVQDADPSFPGIGEGVIETTFPAGNGTGTIAESGLFNASSSGTLLARLLISPTIPKGALDILLVTWTIELS